MNPDHPAASPPSELHEPSDGDTDLARDLAVLRGGATPEPSRRRSRRGRGFVIFLVIAALLGAAAFVARRVWVQPAEVSLVAVMRRDLGLPPVDLTASGHVVAKKQITLSSRAQGKIVEMPIRENQAVSAGDLIARIEHDEQRASLSLARAEFEEAERALGRERGLRARGTASQAQLEGAETAASVARARLDLARVALANTVLRAPIDGTVIRKIRDVGEFVTLGVTAEGDPGTAVVTLADLSALDVSLQISETEIRKVSIGAPALVTPESQPELNILADVTEIAAMADRQKGIVPVKVRIREPVEGLLPDMTAKVRFLASEPEEAIVSMPALPASAVVRRGGRTVVFVAKEDLVEMVPVRTRPVDDETVALEEGPELGTYVVETPPPRLVTGDRIQVGTP